MALSSRATSDILVSAAHASVRAEGDAIVVVESDVGIDIACVIYPKTVSIGLTEGPWLSFTGMDCSWRLLKGDTYVQDKDMPGLVTSPILGPYRCQEQSHQKDLYS